MAIKAGKVVTLGNGFLVERGQNVGAGNLNIPTETIKETGNELNVSVERDIPDLGFDIESLDGTIDTEAMICNVDPSSLVDGDVLTFLDAKPLDVVAPFKAAGSSKVSDGGVIWPYLTLASATYRFGVGQQGATQTFSFQGDSQYSSNRTPYRQEFAGTGNTTPYNFANAAVKTVETGDNIYALSVCVFLANGDVVRLFNETDYTSTSSGVSLVNGAAAPVGSTVAVTYFSAVTSTFAQTIHSTPSVKPGKVKGRYLNLMIGVKGTYQFTGGTTNTDTELTGTGFAANLVGSVVTGTGIAPGTTIATYNSPTSVEMSAPATATGTPVVTLRPPVARWDGVQQVELTWRVTLDYDDELGNAHHVSADYDTPEVSGSITLRPLLNQRLWDKIAQITGTAPNEVANLLSETTLELQIRIQNPKTGDVVKTLRVTDAKILPPAIQARAGQKTEPQFSWSSESGDLQIIKGLPAAA